MELDHLVIVAETLDAGADFVEQAFGVTMAPGGAHAAMGTHNRLLSLGPDLYLEVIAIDPDGRKPGRPRWFDMDRFSGGPRLTNWVVRCDDMEAGLSAPPMRGHVMDLARGDLSWQMAVPDDGVTPYGGLAPGLIRWRGVGHPATRLPEAGCRLRTLTVSLHEADSLGHALADLGDDRVKFASSGAAGLRATFDTPNGSVTLE